MRSKDNWKFFRKYDIIYKNMIFDLIILIILIGGLSLLYFFWFTRLRIHKKHRKYRAVIVLMTFFSLCAIGLLWYGSFIEPRRLAIKYQDILLRPKKENKIGRIILLSDLHTGPFKTKTYIEKITQQIETVEQPDVILLAGDFVSGDERAAIALKSLEKITKKIPTYAVWGNHDFNIGYLNQEIRDDTKVTRKIFKESGITILENENLLIKTLSGQEFWLLGVDSVMARRDDIAKAYYGLTHLDERPKIVLAHNPDIMFSIVQYYIPVDIILTGHSHGGQIRLPIIGSLAEIPIYLGQQYDKGLFDYKGYKLFITSGTGETATRARLFNEPELVVIDIYK